MDSKEIQELDANPKERIQELATDFTDQHRLKARNTERLLATDFTDCTDKKRHKGTKAQRHKVIKETPRINLGAKIRWITAKQ